MRRCLVARAYSQRPEPPVVRVAATLCTMGNQSVSGAMILTAEKRLPSPVSPIYPYDGAPASRPAYGIVPRPGRRAAPLLVSEISG